MCAMRAQETQIGVSECIIWETAKSAAHDRTGDQLHYGTSLDNNVFYPSWCNEIES